MEIMTTMEKKNESQLRLYEVLQKKMSLTAKWHGA